MLLPVWADRKMARAGQLSAYLGSMRKRLYRPVNTRRRPGVKANRGRSV